MARKTFNCSRLRGHSTFCRWPLVLLVASLLCAGCSRSTEPVKHEVHKPVSPPSSSIDLPVDISYPKIPEVPEQITRPSLPIEGDSSAP